MPEKMTNRRESVASAFVEKNGKFLTVFCPRFKVWRVPGGRPEFDEHIEQALIREMQEELGITIEHPLFLGFGCDNQFHHKMQRETSRLIMYFHVKTDQELTIDPDEAQEHKWLSIQEIKELENKEGALEDFFAKFSWDGSGIAKYVW